MHSLIALLPSDGGGASGGGGAGAAVPNGTYAGIKCLVNGVMTLDCIPGMFSLIVTALLSFVGIAALIMLIYSGVQMVIANGDAKTLETAGNTFFYSLIGLLVVLGSFLLINLIATVTGVHCLTGFGFSCTK